jgi:hypothetical protein
MTDFDPIPFSRRHIGPDGESRRAMLKELGCPSLEEFIDEVVPARIRASRPLAIGAGRSEEDVIAALAAMSARNRLFRSFIGMGYHDTVTPAVIVRNVLENPGWYTAYTPYQAEVAQGRLEALLNFQTMVTDLTGMDIANASLLDESTAAAEAMTMFHAIKGHPPGGVFFVSDECHPQNIEVVRTRARPLGIRVVVGSCDSFEFSGDVFGALVQYPATDGAIRDYRTVLRQCACLGSARRLRRRSDEPAPPVSPRRIRRRRRGGIHAAVRCPSRLRRPACRVLRDEGHPQAPHARAHYRGLRGRTGEPGAPHGAADAGAAHQKGKSHVQRLYRAGTPGGHGRHVCRLSRPAGAPPDGRAAARPCTDALRRRARDRARGRPRRFLRHRTDQSEERIAPRNSP